MRNAGSSFSPTYGGNVTPEVLGPAGSGSIPSRWSSRSLTNTEALSGVNLTFLESSQPLIVSTTPFPSACDLTRSCSSGSCTGP